MSRRLRFIPDGGALVEVTSRTLHSRLLFCPRPELKAILIGTLARAKRRHKVRVCFFVCISSHLHLLLWTENAHELARFMGYFLSKLAREAGRLTGWKEKIFGRRYQAIVVSEEEKMQIDRLRYQLAHGAKEDLVDRPHDWPGAHAVRALVDGEPLEGLWFDRTQEYKARRRGESFDRLQYATREILELDPLPCWEHLTPERRQARAAALLADIESEVDARRRRTGAKPLGVAAVLSQDPFQKPRKIKKSPAPAFHVASQALRRSLWDAYSLFVAAYRSAAEKLKAGARDIAFPSGSFPPPLPFVGG